LIDYFELVDCTGRCIREDKASYIEQHHRPHLEATRHRYRIMVNHDDHRVRTTPPHRFRHPTHATTIQKHTDHQSVAGMAKATVLLQHA
jgi:hypothetical protein